MLRTLVCMILLLTFVANPCLAASGPTPGGQPQPSLLPGIAGLMLNAGPDDLPSLTVVDRGELLPVIRLTPVHTARTLIFATPSGQLLRQQSSTLTEDEEWGIATFGFFTPFIGGAIGYLIGDLFFKPAGSDDWMPGGIGLLVGALGLSALVFGISLMLADNSLDTTRPRFAFQLTPGHLKPGSAQGLNWQLAAF